MTKKILWTLFSCLLLVLVTSSVHAFSVVTLNITRSTLGEDRSRLNLVCERAASRPAPFYCDQEHITPGGGSEALCGDGELEGEEECDGSAPDGYICTEQCLLEPTIQPVCGNNQVEPGEACDGSAPAGYVCSNQCTLAPVPANTLDKGLILISEIFPGVDPLHGQDPQNEWVELYNADSKPVNILNWSISDADMHIDNFTQSLVMMPGEFVLVTPAETTFTSFWADKVPSSTKVITLDNPIGDGLVALGDAVELRRGELVYDDVSYGANRRIFILPSLQPGQSLVRHNPGVDTDAAGDWQVNSSPTPGF